jgi:hypothetical protein
MVSGVYSAPATPALKTLPAFSYFPLKAWPETASYCLSMVSILRIAVEISPAILNAVFGETFRCPMESGLT